MINVACSKIIYFLAYKLLTGTYLFLPHLQGSYDLHLVYSMAAFHFVSGKSLQTLLHLAAPSVC
jgi:hypothetical protein